ncbi:MAG: basic amino acid ABC transporter substrate-binding protein [Firmicutes bacterium]|nr:basic amino acid ABC transporter substrate-binding protein [Bacillota bacterium]
MKKLIGWSLLLALLLTVGLTGCGGGSGAADDDNGEDGGLAEKAVIKWGTNAAFPPFESINPQTGEVEGFDKDLADIIGEELGVEMEVVDTSFETLFAGLESKKYDLVIAGVTIKTSRLEKMDFSDPYFEAGQVIVVRADYDEIEDEYDFAGKRIGVQISTTADDFVSDMQAGEEDYEGTPIDIKEIKRYDNYPQAFLDLQHGNIEAVVVDEPVGKPYVQEHGDKVKLVSDEPFIKEKTAIAFRKGDTEMVEKINAILAKIMEDGRYDALVEKWFPEDEN